VNSNYERNVLDQPEVWKRLLNAKLPSELESILSSSRRLVFVGIGSSYWAARFSEFLWRDYAFVDGGDKDPISFQSFDFVRIQNLHLNPEDLVIVFSHRGTKTFSMHALEIAKKKYGATTVLITGIGSPITKPDIVDSRIETCAQETCGAFTISLTSAIVRIIQLIGYTNKSILDRFRKTVENLMLPFEVQLPTYYANLVIVGDLIREVVAREVSLKIAETTYLPVRSYGLEEFLHGPRVTLDRQTSLLLFSTISEPRRESLIKYARTIGSEVIDIYGDLFRVPEEFRWLCQLVLGQTLALELSKKLGTNPDTVRADHYPYDKAKENLML
jgi:glucosamine--fructose-6-phosphate aminotransferase (isomerizing)